MGDTRCQVYQMVGRANVKMVFFTTSYYTVILQLFVGPFNIRGDGNFPYSNHPEQTNFYMTLRLK